MLDTLLIERILAAIPGRTIGLIGDLFLDRYLDIDPARDEPSVETGLTAYQVVGVRAYPGALGTVLNNLVALGVGRTLPIAAIGDDGEGYELRQALAAMRGVDSTHVFSASGRRTPTYTKPMYGKQELNRLDIKNRTPTPAAIEEEILARLDAAWPQVDALLVLDQVSEEDCGVITRRVRERLAELGGLQPEKFVLADSRERIGLFRNVCVKPNERELAGGRIEPGRAAFFTRGERGIDLQLPDGRPAKHIPAYPVSGPIDICGAGDSCSAGIASAMVSGATLEQAAAFGNLVASITIRQIGVTGTASPAQIRAAIG
ncbi:MAG: PfkB family carbohydrate kinase [Gemmataceae bacterium]